MSKKLEKCQNNNWPKIKKTFKETISVKSQSDFFWNYFK